MKLSEIEEKIAEIRTEYGDNEAVTPDVLEPGWICAITDVQFDHDRQVTVFSTD